MSTETAIPVERHSPAAIEATIGSVRKMLLVGAIFAAVGWLLVIGALVLEITQFHPLLMAFFSDHTAHSLAGGGADRAGQTALNSDLASIHQFPSTLLWLKLGGIAHVLVGIFIVLVAIVRTLSLVPHRLSYEMERTQD